MSIYASVLVSLSMISVTQADASMFGSFVSKVKLVISPKENPEETGSIYKINILTPAIVEAKEEDIENNTPFLEVKSGPMRLSTEEIDHPLEDTITQYEVKNGDTIASVAKLFSVSPNTILWANDLPNKTIKEGDVIVILPVTGIKYISKKGDTLASVAKKYKGDTQEIARYNGIAQDSDLAVGQEVIIPDGEVFVDKPAPTTATNSKKVTKKIATTPLGFFVKPLISFIKTQGIHGKNGVDLATKVGSPVVATASGKVIIAKPTGYNGGYGEMIVIAHKNNIQTLYAHLSNVNVKQGDTVEQGQVIGAVGNTGRSTGSHLHIEVRGAVNPF